MLVSYTCTKPRFSPAHVRTAIIGSFTKLGDHSRTSCVGILQGHEPGIINYLLPYMDGSI